MQKPNRAASLPLQAAFATASVVGLQVLLPRVFSVLLWYHLGFLAVSLAMLGFATGGRLVRWRAARTGEPGGGLDRPLLGALAGLAAPLSIVGILRLPLEPTQLLDDPMAMLAMLGMVVALAIPFLCLGTLVCSALDAGRESIGRVYGATFLGGAFGALLTLGAMELGGTPLGLALVAVLPLLPRPRLLGLGAVAVAAAILALPAEFLPFTSRKHFPALKPEQVLLERDTATTHTVFYENTEHHGMWAAEHPDYYGPIPRSIAAAIDAWAITFITQRKGPDDFPAYLDAHPAGLAYEGVPPEFDALVIGAGGGWDVLQALKAGARHVTAVEINASIVESVETRWAEYSGNLYQDPRVEVHVAEGRHYLENDNRLYDRIVLAGVDTFAATQAGAFALSENYLYTVEAIKTYMARLKPGGRLFMTRWWFQPPRQTLRLALTAAQAMRDEGVTDPRKRMFIAKGQDSMVFTNALFFMKGGSDFTIGELDALEFAVRKRGLEQGYAWASPWDNAPRPSNPTLVAALDAEAKGKADAWQDDYPYRVDPSTDDRPFFFENGKLQTLFRSQGNWIHDRVGGQEVLVVTLLALLLLAWPLLLLGARSKPADASNGNKDEHEPSTGITLAPFLFLGIGFLFVEIPLMQRLSLVLGHPLYAVTVVLVSLLTWSGIGSILTQRMSPRSAPFLLVATAITIAVVLVGGHEVMVETVSHWDLPLRIAAVVLYLALPGLVMGAGFPMAVRGLGSSQPLLVPSAFTWNGFASVLAGPLSVLVALQVGFRVTLLFGALCYVFAALMLLLARHQGEDDEDALTLAMAGAQDVPTGGGGGAESWDEAWAKAWEPPGGAAEAEAEAGAGSDEDEDEVWDDPFDDGDDEHKDARDDSEDAPRGPA